MSNQNNFDVNEGGKSKFMKGVMDSGRHLCTSQIFKYVKVILTKVVFTFYLRLRNEFQPFPTKNSASNWLTQQVNQS